MYKKIGQFTGNAEIIKKAARFQKGLNKEQAVSHAFSHFLTNNWVFSTQKLAIMEKLMSKDDIRRFPIDVSKLDWRSYMSNFSYGLRKFVLRENVETPSSDPHALNLNWDYRTKQYFSDIMWAYNHGEPINIRHNKDIKNLILNGAKVQETIRRIVEEQKSGKDVNKAIAEQVKKAEFIMDRMLCDIKMPLVRVFGWFLRKV